MIAYFNRCWTLIIIIAFGKKLLKLHKVINNKMKLKHGYKTLEKDGLYAYILIKY